MAYKDAALAVIRHAVQRKPKGKHRDRAEHALRRRVDPGFEARQKIPPVERDR
jgi:hypothetical protein